LAAVGCMAIAATGGFGATRSDERASALDPKESAAVFRTNDWSTLRSRPSLKPSNKPELAKD